MRVPAVNEAFKLVERKSVKGAPILYLYGQKYMASIFCADQAEADIIRTALARGFDGLHGNMLGATIEITEGEPHAERTS